jgi:LytS/YehU family sensor histidine kinase
LELEKRALQAQMNPHFIYNSMNSIQQFMIVHDVEGAMKYLTRFSRILRSVLNLSSQNRIPLYDEINLIKDYLELENMRFPDKFSYTIQVAPDINIHTVEIPPFFIQPQVENAIRHGLLKKPTPGHLRIEIALEHMLLQIIVEDNGIGREATMREKQMEGVSRESRGLAIIEERLSHLHSNNGFKPFTIIDLYDVHQKPIGTRVEISIPIE